MRKSWLWSAVRCAFSDYLNIYIEKIKSCTFCIRKNSSERKRDPIKFIQNLLQIYHPLSYTAKKPSNSILYFSHSYNIYGHTQTNTPLSNRFPFFFLIFQVTLCAVVFVFPRANLFYFEYYLRPQKNLE